MRLGGSEGEWRSGWVQARMGGNKYGNKYLSMGGEKGGRQ